MQKDEMGIGDIIVESLTIFGMIMYLGLQMFYRSRYQISIQTMIYHIVPVILLYLFLLLLQYHPEFLNGKSSEPVKGKVRIYAVRMVRICKLLIVYGILIPTVADILETGIHGAYSLVVMLCILVVIAYYIFRIYQYNREEDKKNKKKKK